MWISFMLFGHHSVCVESKEKMKCTSLHVPYETEKDLPILSLFCPWTRPSLYNTLNTKLKKHTLPRAEGKLFSLSYWTCKLHKCVGVYKIRTSFLKVTAACRLSLFLSAFFSNRPFQDLFQGSFFDYIPFSPSLPRSTWLF